VITVKIQMRPEIHARIVTADGKPFANARIRARLQFMELGGGSGGSGHSRPTDKEGYFTIKLAESDKLRFCILGIEAEGFLAKSDPFIFQKGQPEVHLLLTLSDQPIVPPFDQGHDTTLDTFLNPPTVWAINPENGHAYKSIRCQTRAEATIQAQAENAYLVTINDPAEEEWLQEIFGRDTFWIGLSDTDREGHWQWDNNEPLTYTNWRQPDQQAPQTSNTEIKDYVIKPHGSTWIVVQEGYPFVRRAILERAEAPAKTTTENH